MLVTINPPGLCVFQDTGIVLDVSLVELLMEGPQLFTKLVAHLRVTPIAICLESNPGEAVQLVI